MPRRQGEQFDENCSSPVPPGFVGNRRPSTSTLNPPRTWTCRCLIVPTLTPAGMTCESDPAAEGTLGERLRSSVPVQGRTPATARPRRGGGNERPVHRCVLEGEGGQRRRVHQWLARLHDAWATQNAPGAKSFTLIRNMSDPQSFISFGTWTDRDSIHAWWEMPGFADRYGRVAELCEDQHRRPSTRSRLSLTPVPSGGSRGVPGRVP